MSTVEVARSPVSWESIDLVALYDQARQTAIEKQNWPILYPGLYEATDSMEGRNCAHRFDGPFRDHQACIAEVNALMAILKAEVVEPLSQIPNFHKRVYAKVWDPKLVEDVTRVFLSRMTFLAPPPDRVLGPRILNGRDEARMRTVNLMVYKFGSLMGDLVKFYERQFSIPKSEAIASVVGSRISVADIIACWMAYCAAKDFVNGDGTYTGREMRKTEIGKTAWI